jgi:predicted secreted hydrolase
MRKLALLFLSLVLAACSGQQEPSPRSDVPLTERMAATPDPGFARAYAPREFEFPADHGAHPDYATEWWYFTGNLASSENRRFGYQLTLFRVGLAPGEPPQDSNWRSHQIYMGHLAVSDLDREIHVSAERFNRAAAGLAGASSDPLRVWLGPWSMQGDGDPFPLQLQAATETFALRLQVDAGDKPKVLQGERGLSRKGADPGNASYYYSFTRLPTRGEILVEGVSHDVTGLSWFDREWSSSALAADQAGWDWFALQFDDGSDLMFYRMRGVDGQAQRFSKGVFVHADGSQVPLAYDDVRLSPTRFWQADATTRYPLEWQLEAPGLGISISVAAVFDAQEMDHSVRYWEGAVIVDGTRTGRGYMELSGYAGEEAE